MPGPRLVVGSNQIPPKSPKIPSRKFHHSPMGKHPWPLTSLSSFPKRSPVIRTEVNRCPQRMVPSLTKARDHYSWPTCARDHNVFDYASRGSSPPVMKRSQPAANNGDVQFMPLLLRSMNHSPAGVLKLPNARRYHQKLTRIILVTASLGGPYGADARAKVKLGIFQLAILVSTLQNTSWFSRSRRPRVWTIQGLKPHLL